MLFNTRGIALHTIDYSDNSIIARVYTERFGLQGYMVNSARSKKAKVKASLFQPLALLDMVVYHKEKSRLHRISEARTAYPFSTIPYDIVKTSIVMFLNEVVYKSIKEEEPNERLFGFLFNSMQILDLQAGSTRNFHLCFLVQLSKYLGFFPQGIASFETPFFDLHEGVFVPKEPLHPYYLDPALSLILSQITETDFHSAAQIAISNIERRALLSKLINYYELHLESLRDINSHLILEEVLG